MQQYVSQRIRELRMAQGMSQTELADKCNVSKSLISKIESNKATIHLDLLLGIAQALEVTLYELLDTHKEPKKKASVVRQTDRRRMAAGVPGKTGYRYYRLAGSEKVSTFWLAIGLEAVKAPRWVTHEGHEFLYIVSGHAKLQFRDEEYRLTEGDTAYFDSRAEHKIIPVNCEAAQIIIVFAHD